MGKRRYTLHGIILVANSSAPLSSTHEIFQQIDVRDFLALFAGSIFVYNKRKTCIFRCFRDNDSLFSCCSYLLILFFNIYSPNVPLHCYLFVDIN